MGAGPMTGRGAGYCAGFATPGFANPGRGGRLGRGMGMGMARNGRGGGFGFRNRFYAQPPVQQPVQQPLSAEQEKDYLAHEAKALEEELAAVKKRLNELGNE
jgi:hypothetical protein